MRWEYFTHKIDVSGWFIDGEVDEMKLTAVLSQFGSEGWELVSSFATASGGGGSNNLVFIFKRPKGDA